MIACGRTRQQRLVGAGTLRRLDEVPEFFEARHVLLVHGRRSLEASGAGRILDEMMAHLQVRRYTGFAPNPTLASLEAGLARLAEGPCHVIVAVGGGTALDLAKLLSACAGRPEDGLEDIRAGRALSTVGPPVLAVPRSL